LCCAAAYATLPAVWRACYVTPGAEPATPVAARRQAVLAAAAAGAALADSRPAEAFGKGTDAELIKSDANSNTGTRPYVYQKPKGFRQYASPVDPSSFIFRNSNDTYYSFISRAELKPNASTDFTPDQFIADYKSKFTNATGSSFALISATDKPFKVDKALGVKYYKIEYVVRTQLGFAFDSLRSLHFLTVFAAAPESIYILNCQDQDENWEKHKGTLGEVADSFAVTGDAPAQGGFSFFR